MSGKSKFEISHSLDTRIKRIIRGTNEYDTEFSQVPSAYILGFNYGNVTNCVALTTNYQLHHAVFPVVGLVFFDRSPNDDDIKSSLKSIQEYSSSPNGLGSFKSDKNEHLFLIYSFNKNANEVEQRIFNFTKGTFTRRKRSRLNILNDPYCPRQVHRGSEDLFTLNDGDSLSSTEEEQIDHLIFFIHGVGGVCDVRFRSCVEVVADFRKMANSLLAQHSNPSSGVSTPSHGHIAQHLKKGLFRKHSSDSNHDSEYVHEVDQTRPARPRKVECLPISWHSCTRRQTGISDQLDLISLNSVPKMRHFLNKVVIDALLYASGPVYTQTILNNVGDEINRLYTLFMERHPNFNGSVSLAGHSLGSVIVFDLLANQIPVEPSSKTSQVENESNLDESEKDDHKENDDLPNIRRDCRNTSHHHHDLDQKDLGSCTQYKNLNELLKDMNLMQYSDLFQKEHIDIDTLLLLTDLDLKELHIPLGPRRKLCTYINFSKVSKFQASPSIMDPSIQQATNSETRASKGNNSTSLTDNMNTGQYLVKYPQLKFKPRCFFSFGSPMPMFLNVRGVQNLSREYKLPTCDRMFNIFHPYDPLAYRIEPLINPIFRDVEPVQVAHHRGGKRMHVQLRESFARVGHDIKHRLFGSIKSTWSSFTRFNGNTQEQSNAETLSDRRQRLTKSASSSVDVEIASFEASLGATPKQSKILKHQYSIRSQSDLNIISLDSIIEGSVRQNLDIENNNADSTRKNSFEPFLTPDNDDSQDKQGSCRKNSETGEGNEHNNSYELPLDTSKIGKLNGGRRLDYVLQEKPIELFNEYISAFISHANYWQNEDSALMMLNEIYLSDGVQLFDME